MIKRILVALAGTPYTSVEIKAATQLARLHEATVTGVTVVDEERLASTGPVPLGGGKAAQDLAEFRLTQVREKIDQALADFETACSQVRVPFQTIREKGDPFQKLVSLWRYHDVTILGLRSLFEFGVIDEPEDELINLISAGVRPVMAVSSEFHPIERVLVAYDGSMEAAKAMKQFIQMRLWPSLGIRIACVDEGQSDILDLLNDAQDYCRDHGFGADTVILNGSPGQALLTEASNWKADIIVAGNSHRRLITRKVFGDTALSLIRKAECTLYLSQ